MWIQSSTLTSWITKIQISFNLGILWSSHVSDFSVQIDARTSRHTWEHLRVSFSRSGYLASCDATVLLPVSCTLLCRKEWWIEYPKDQEARRTGPPGRNCNEINECLPNSCEMILCLTCLGRCAPPVKCNMYDVLYTFSYMNALKYWVCIHIIVFWKCYSRTIQAFSHRILNTRTKFVVRNINEIP